MRLRIGGMSLRVKIILLSTFIVLVVTILYGAAFTREIRSVLFESMIKRGESMVEHLAFNTRYGVIAEDSIILTQITDGFFKDPDVSFISIYNGEKRNLLWRFKEEELSGEKERVRTFLEGNPKVRKFVSLTGNEYIAFTSPVSTAKVGEEGESVVHGYVILGLNTHYIEQRFRRMLYTVGGFFFLFLFTVGGISALLADRAIKPLKNMTALTQHIASGDLKHTVEVDEAGEVGMLAESFNTMVFYLNQAISGLKTVVSDIKDAVVSLNQVSSLVEEGSTLQNEHVQKTSVSIEEINSSIKEIVENVDILSASAEESSSSILEMSASIEQVAEHADVLMSAVEETTSSLDEMIVSIKQVAANVESLREAQESIASSVTEFDYTIRQVEENANESAKSVEIAKAHSDEGVKSVESTIEGMKHIKETMLKAANEVSELVGKINKIGNIVGVIEEITEQTNLLALNAAIIAAQAGEHGRSFSVVADAIKKLADRTAISTGEIKAIIEDIQSSANITLESMQAGMKTIEEGVQLSLNAGKVLRKISESAVLAMTKSREIANAMAEQAESSRELKEAIEKIKDRVDEIARATKEQAKGGDRIASAAQKVKEIAEHLKSSTQEQEKGSKHIAKAIENITEMIKYIHKATEEQSKNTGMVLESINAIASISNRNLENMHTVRGLLSRLNEHVGELEKVIQRFKIKEEKKRGEA